MQQSGEHEHGLEHLDGRLLRLLLLDPGETLRDRLPAEAPEGAVEAPVGVGAVRGAPARRRLTQLLQLRLVEPDGHTGGGGMVNLMETRGGDDKAGEEMGDSGCHGKA